MSTFGPHVIFDLSVCKVPREDRVFISAFMLDLVEEIGLKPMGKVHMDLYSGPHEEWEGYSATLHIETSHVTAHFFRFGYVFLDVFSCKPFDVSNLRSYVEERLCPKTVDMIQLSRGYTFPPELLDNPPGGPVDSKA